MMQLFLILILVFAPIARGAVRIWAFAPVYILTLLTLFLCIVKQFSSGEIAIKRTPLDMPILLFMIFSLTAILNSGDIYASIMEFIKFINLALIFYIVINFIKEEKDIKKLLNVILMVGTGIALFGILQYLGVIDRAWWDRPMFLSATYVNHNHFAGLMELVIPLSIGMILSEKDLGKRSLYIYAFLILFAAFLLSMSRGGWFSLAVSMIFMAVLISRKGKIRFIVFMSALLLVVFGGFILKTTGLNVLLERVSSYRELDFSGRLEIWKGTLGIIKHHWLLGTGAGTFIYNFPRYRPAGLNMLVNYAHNDYLQVFSEMGILALGLMVFIIAGIIKKGLTTFKIARTPFKSWISISLAAGVLSMSIHGLGDFNFYIPANAIIFTVFSGLIFNISSKKEKKCPEVRLKAGPVLCRIFKCLAVIIVAVSAAFLGIVLAAEIYSTASDRAIIKNDLERAEGLSLTAIRLCPFNHLYPYKLANIYDKQAENEADDRGHIISKSVERYKEALHLNSIDAWSWIGLADSYYRLSRYSLINGKLLESADSAYRKAIDLDPMNWYYLKKYAGFLLNSGGADWPIKMYRKTLYAISKSKAPSWTYKTFADGGHYKDRADMAFAAQDIDKALVYYKIAEAFDGKDEYARLGQIRCYIKMSLIKDALLIYKKSKYSAGNKSIFFASLGEYYLNNGYIRTAERFSEKSQAADPAGPESCQLRYKILKKTGGEYPAEEAYKILDFNRVPVSLDFKADAIVVKFDIKKDIYAETGEGVDIDIFLPAGMYEFSVNAKGREANGIPPHMIVKFDDKYAMDAYVGEDWEEYPGIIIVDCPANRFTIVFDNDYYDEESMEDRNLFIEGIRLRTL